ncbi:MAG TPA: hypothetical protein PLE18_13605, partial [Candidatus Sumerlaeota bacterium]|nr:hypothetical protein [Candidatus Sumerlaeota bacterium]
METKETETERRAREYQRQMKEWFWGEVGNNFELLKHEAPKPMIEWLRRYKYFDAFPKPFEVEDDIDVAEINHRIEVIAEKDVYCYNKTEIDKSAKLVNLAAVVALHKAIRRMMDLFGEALWLWLFDTIMEKRKVII